MSRVRVTMLRKQLKEFWRRYRKNRAAVLGLVFVLFISLVAIFAPYVAPRDPFAMIDESLLPPSVENPFGTDYIGRDVFSQVIYGTRISLFVGFLATVTSVLIGVMVGSISGYCGGKIDSILMRMTEFFQIIPALFLAITLLSIYGPTLWNIIIVIGATSWPRTARIVRGAFLSLKNAEFVEAARTQGFSDANIIFDEILPNAFSPVIVTASLEVAAAITLEASLSFLGLSDPRVFSWGRILFNAQRYIMLGVWWILLTAGAAIFLTVLGLNLIGDGLNEALNPRLKEG